MQHDTTASFGRENNTRGQGAYNTTQKVQMDMRGEMDEFLYRMEWGDVDTEWERNLKAKMIDLGNTRLKTREYQITDLGIIPVLPTQRRKYQSLHRTIPDLKLIPVITRHTAIIPERYQILRIIPLKSKNTSRLVQIIPVG